MKKMRRTARAHWKMITAAGTAVGALAVAGVVVVGITSEDAPQSNRASAPHTDAQQAPKEPQKTEPQRLSRADYIAEVDEACRQAQSSGTVDASTDPQGALRETASIIREPIFSTRAYPADSEKFVGAIEDLLESRASDLETAATSLDNGDQDQAAAMLGRSNATYRIYRDLARGYGLEVCGSADEGILEDSAEVQAESPEYQQAIRQYGAEGGSQSLVTCVTIFQRRYCQPYQRPTGAYRHLYGTRGNVNGYYANLQDYIPVHSPYYGRPPVYEKQPYYP